MFIERDAKKQLEQILASGKVGIVLGARQVGKTTLVEHSLQGKKSRFLNFDLPSDQAIFESAAVLPPRDALKVLGSPEFLVIDEAQRMPAVSQIVKGWHDARLPLRVLLLGSSSLNLLNQSAESLTGRNRKLTLPPLLFHETLQATDWYNADITAVHITKHFSAQISATLLERMCYGSYPEVVTSSEPVRILRDLCVDYLWKDVLQSGLARTPDTMRRLLLLLAHQTGSEVSINELAMQLGVARPTVEKYISLLEETFVIFRLPAFSSNPRKEISKSQKIFFWDTGVRNALLNQLQPVVMRPDIGALWENWAIAEIAKRNLLDGAHATLYFWRTRAQSEVDLVISEKSTLRAYEMKWSPRSKAKGQAFFDAYGISPEIFSPQNALEILKGR